MKEMSKYLADYKKYEAEVLKKMKSKWIIFVTLCLP